MKWNIATIAEVAEIDRRGVSPETLSLSTLYVGLEHIDSMGAVNATETVESAALRSTKFRFTPNHVLFGKLRPYLRKIARPKFDGVCSTDILPILPGKGLDADYLYHFLRQPAQVELATRRSSGANLPRLSPKALAKFEIPLPPLAEQKRIAEILDAADALRAKRRESLAQLDALLQSTFLTLFGDPVANPMGWEAAFLDDLFQSGPQNGLYKPSTEYGSGIRILRIDGFYNGTVTSLDSLKRVRVTEKELRTYRLAENDIVINRVNSRPFLGKSALIPHLNEPTVYESNMMRFAVDEGRAHPRFLVEFLQSRYVKNQILSAAKDAVNQSSINQKDVKSLRVLLPSLNLQRRFAAIVESVEQQKTRLRTYLAELDALFASLQSRAFNGEL